MAERLTDLLPKNFRMKPRAVIVTNRLLPCRNHGCIDDTESCQIWKLQAINYSILLGLRDEYGWTENSTQSYLAVVRSTQKRCPQQPRLQAQIDRIENLMDDVFPSRGVIYQGK